MAMGRTASALISCLRDTENTPYKCVKVNALNRDPWAADPPQCRLLKIKTVDRAGLPVQTESIVKTPDAGHIAGIAEQHRTPMFI